MSDEETSIGIEPWDDCGDECVRVNLPFLQGKVGPAQAHEVATDLVRAADELKCRNRTPDDESEDYARAFGTSVSVCRPADAAEKIREWRETLSYQLGGCDRVGVLVLLPDDQHDWSFGRIMHVEVRGPEGTIEDLMTCMETMAQAIPEK